MSDTRLAARIGRTVLGPLAVLAMVLTSMIALSSTPAAASATQCKSDTPAPAWWSICVVVSGSNVSGYARWYYSDGYFNPANVWVEICRPGRVACSTLTNRTQSGTNIVSTPTKTTAGGHIYRACSTFSVRLQGTQYWNWVTAQCSPYVTV